LVRGNHAGDEGVVFTLLRRGRRSHLRRMNSVAFIIIAIFTLAAALAAATLPNLMHAALCLVLALLGLASFFFLLGAEFVGLALVFIYIGAVAVLIVFTILLTRRDSREDQDINPPARKATAGRAWSGVLVAVAVFGGLTWAILKTPSLAIVPTHVRVLTVKQIGQTLMIGYVWPLQCVGVLLTAALIGALILVMEEKQ
jgi:NADH-quinone oxidoreductase subunit J